MITTPWILSKKRIYSTTRELCYQIHVLTWIMRRRIGIGSLAKGLAYNNWYCRRKVFNVKWIQTSYFRWKIHCQYLYIWIIKTHEFHKGRILAKWKKQLGQENRERGKEARDVYIFIVVLLENFYSLQMYWYPIFRLLSSPWHCLWVWNKECHGACS